MVGKMKKDDARSAQQPGSVSWTVGLAAPWIGLMFVRRSQEGGTGGKQVMIDGEDRDGQTNKATV